MQPGTDPARKWIDQGKLAYQQMQLSEAYAHFEKAVTADPGSVEARLCFGVICLFQYQNGSTDLIPEFYLATEEPSWSEDDISAEIERVREALATLNATHGRRAEENLLRAIELDRGNALAMEYLAYLYFDWLDNDTDSPGATRASRLTEAKHWYKQILEIYPEHRFANYVCGVIDWKRAFELIRSSGTFPLPLPSEEVRQSLHSQVTPLLDEAVRNLLRALEIDPEDPYPSRYMSLVKDLQSYVAATKEESSRASAEAGDWNRRTKQRPRSGAISFAPVEQTGNVAPQLFPPDPKWMIPPPPPPPPPPLK
ncbi:MAG: hypothetical protein R2762_14010 [Bryobacteraceae bacterium]